MKKNKKIRKYDKWYKLRNKKLVKKYPWLKPIKWAFRGHKEIRDPHYDYTWIPFFVNVPGWWRSFGKMMADEINVLFEKCPDLYVIDWKEKWGGLRIDFGNATREILDVANKYEVLSQNICYYCGKPDTPLTDTGWVLPICKRCYEHKKDEIWGNKPYDEIVVDDGKMSEEITWKYFNSKEEIIDISDTANRIRENWHG